MVLAIKGHGDYSAILALGKDEEGVVRMKCVPYGRDVRLGEVCLVCDLVLVLSMAMSRRWSWPGLLLERERSTRTEMTGSGW